MGFVTNNNPETVNGAAALTGVVFGNPAGGTVSISTANPTESNVHLTEGEYVEIGNTRYYTFIFLSYSDELWSVSISDATHLIPTYQQHLRLGTGDLAAGQCTMVNQSANSISLDRDNNISGMTRVELRFIALM